MRGSPSVRPIFLAQVLEEVLLAQSELLAGYAASFSTRTAGAIRSSEFEAREQTYRGIAGMISQLGLPRFAALEGFFG